MATGADDFEGHTRIAEAKEKGMGRIELTIPSGVIYAEFTVTGEGRDATFCVPEGYTCEDSYDKTYKQFKICAYRCAKGADALVDIPWGFKLVSSDKTTIWRVNGLIHLKLFSPKLFKQKYFADFMTTKELPYGKAHYLFVYDEKGKGVGEAIRTRAVPLLCSAFEGLEDKSATSFKSAIGADAQIKKLFADMYNETATELDSIEVVSCEGCDNPNPDDLMLSHSDMASRFMGSVVAVHTVSTRGTAFVVGRHDVTVDGEEKSELYLLSARHVVYELSDSGEFSPHKFAKASFKSSVTDYEIEALGYALSADLALFKITVPRARAEGADIIPLAKKPPKEGSEGMLLGNDLGKSIVPLFGRIIEVEYEENGTTYLRCDTPANVGSSGGPLITGDGKCVGVHCSGKNLEGSDIARGVLLYVPLYNSEIKAELDMLLSKIEGEN